MSRQRRRPRATTIHPHDLRRRRVAPTNMDTAAPVPALAICNRARPAYAGNHFTSDGQVLRSIAVLNVCNVTRQLENYITGSEDRPFGRSAVRHEVYPNKPGDFYRACLNV
jgi:hypothetical protein